MIRKAKYEDVDAIMEVVADAQLSLRELGIDQWQDGYPSREVILSDIESGVGNVLTDTNNQVVGYVVVVFTGEETYAQLPAEAWHTPEEYVVVHRLCVARKCCRGGVATELMKFAADMARRRGVRGFRIDTHRGNVRMLAMLEKFGFEYCGVIYYPSGERLAYDLDITNSKLL